MSNEYVRLTSLKHKEWRGWPDVITVRGSVIPLIFPNVCLIIGWAVAVVIAESMIDGNIGLPNALIPSLSVVLGLLLVFRTNTAYDRYWEGRRTFGTLITSMRTLSRYIWLGVDDHVSNATEKRQFLDLLLAYVVAIKHHLREEYGTDYADLEHLLPAQFKDARNHLGDYEVVVPGPDLASPFLVDPNSSMNLPLEISFYLGLYQQRVYSLNGMTGSLYGNMFGALAQATECLSVFERIRTTPIPFSYRVHMKQSLFLYCLLLPFTFVEELGWITPAIMALVSFTLFGIEGIGREIENPFGYDSNDLPMDAYCEELRLELRYLAARVPEKGDTIGSTEGLICSHTL